MSGNDKFGKQLRLAIHGASHASKISFELENFPAGITIDEVALNEFMERRAPGRDLLSTQRRESDAVKFVKGVKGNVTTGETIVGEIANEDVRPQDYGEERTIPRPGHADFGQWVEMGRIPTGGGKNSGRMTAAICAAGALCKQYLAQSGIVTKAELIKIGGQTTDFEKMIEAARKNGDSVGGVVKCTIVGLPAGLGGALFDGLESEMAAAMWAISGVKGVEFGNGFASADACGSQDNDCFRMIAGKVIAATNRQGGVMGGRTNGGVVEFSVAFRPTPTIFKPQDSVDLATMKDAVCTMKGRHDPCIARRAVAVVEAMASIVAADMILADQAAHPRICLTLTGKTIEEDIAQYESQRYFTDMVELRADLLNEAERNDVGELIVRMPLRVPVILTLRRKTDGGAFEGSEQSRIEFFKEVLNRGFDYVDFESDFHIPELEALAKANNTKIIRSKHIFKGSVEHWDEELTAIVGGRDEIAKIAFMPNSLLDISKAYLSLMKGDNLPAHVVCAMGPQGVVTRVLAQRMGSLWTYASVRGLKDLGHLTPQELVRDYRFRTLTKDTALFGVTGWPLMYTKSPSIHNSAFANEDEDAVMVPLPAATAQEAFSLFIAMKMKGMAVTIPHKQTMLKELGQHVDATVKSVGAVNTLLRVGEKDIAGFNTDVVGFSQAITRFAGDVKGKRVALLGNGGAAKAVALALKKLSAEVTVFHRETPPQGYDLIVNATPVDPIPDYVFTGKELVYDLRYSPEVTPLMERAAQAGCKVENGLSMLKAQALAQREIWMR